MGHLKLEHLGSVIETSGRFWYGAGQEEDDLNDFGEDKACSKSQKISLKKWMLGQNGLGRKVGDEFKSVEPLSLGQTWFCFGLGCPL